MSEIVKFETPELLAIEPSKAAQIKAVFEPMAEMLEEFEAQYSDIVQASENGIDGPLTAKAKRLRIDIGKVRIATEKARVSQKEEYLRAGKAIDGVSNILKWAVTDRENKLKEIEDYFTIQEQERLSALQAKRVRLLCEYVEDAGERDLSGMEEDVWQAYLGAKKKEHEDRIEAERKAEAERLEAERIEKEKAEAAKKASQAPDRDKLINYINSFEFGNLDLKTDNGKVVLKTIAQKFGAFRLWAIQQAESL